MQSKRITNIIIIKYSQIRFNTMKQSKMQSKRITKLKVMRGDLNPPVDLTQWRWAMACGRNGWLAREKALTVDRGVITGTQVSLITLIRGLLLSCGGARLIGWASGGTTRTRCIRGEGFRSYEQRLCLSPLWKGLVGDWRHSCLSPPGVRETVTAVTHITLTGERETVTCITHITLTGVRETVSEHNNTQQKQRTLWSQWEPTVFDLWPKNHPGHNQVTMHYNLTYVLSHKSSHQHTHIHTHTHTCANRHHLITQASI